MKSEATSIVISFALVFALHMPQTLAADTGGDSISEEDRDLAKALMSEAIRLQREKKLSLALDMMAAAHRLAPNRRSACISAVMASNLERNVEAAERYKDCIERAIAIGLKTSNPSFWKVILGDNEIVRSRISVLRLSADPLVQVSVDGRVVGFASEHRELFLEPNTMHTITGDNGMGMHARAEVKMNAGERRDLFLRVEGEPQSEESPTKSVVQQAMMAEAEKPMPTPVAQMHAEPKDGGKWITAALGGGAAVGLVATAISAALAWNTGSIADAQLERARRDNLDCDHDQDPRCLEANSLNRSATMFTGLSVGFGALSTLLGGTAIVLHVISPSSPSGSAQTLPKTRHASKPAQGFLGLRWSASF